MRRKNEAMLSFESKDDGLAEEFCEIQTVSRGDLALAAVVLELKAYLPAMKTVVATARRSQMDGETVPASERVFSSIILNAQVLLQRGLAVGIVGNCTKVIDTPADFFCTSNPCPCESAGGSPCAAAWTWGGVYDAAGRR